jgi:hypothetical protein
MRPVLHSKLDAWIAEQPDPVSRPEAILQVAAAAEAGE